MTFFSLCSFLDMRLLRVPMGPYVIYGRYHSMRFPYCFPYDRVTAYIYISTYFRIFTYIFLYVHISQYLYSYTYIFVLIFISFQFLTVFIHTFIHIFTPIFNPIFVLFILLCILTVFIPISLIFLCVFYRIFIGFPKFFQYTFPMVLQIIFMILSFSRLISFFLTLQMSSVCFLIFLSIAFALLHC